MFVCTVKYECLICHLNSRIKPSPFVILFTTFKLNGDNEVYWALQVFSQFMRSVRRLHHVHSTMDCHRSDTMMQALPCPVWLVPISKSSRCDCD